MGRIKDGFNNLGGRLKKLPGGRQGKAFVRIIQFFALMVVLTIFARGAAGTTMPLVTTTALTSQSIRNSADYSGTVMSAGRTEIKLPAGLEVTRVHVYPGSTVKVDDDLVSFDMEAINESVTAQQIALQELRLALAELQKNKGQDDSAVVSAQKAVDEAQKAYDSAVSGGDSAVKKAEKNLTNAKKAEEAANKDLPPLKTAYDDFKAAASDEDKTTYNNWEEDRGIPNAVDNSALYKLYLKWGEIWGPYKTARDALASAEAETVLAKSALSTAKADRKSNIELAEKTLAGARETLAEAQADYNEATPDYNLQNQKNQLEIKKKQQEIEAQQKLLDELYKMQGLSGVVRATAAGTVTEVTAVAGVDTTETDHVYISTGAEGFEVQFSVPQAKAREIKPGNQVSVMLQNYYWGIEARVIGKGLADEGGNITVRAQLTSTDWNEGDAVTVTVVSSDRQYWQTVPVAAIRPDADGHYVLVVAEKSTILGQQSVATKVPVTIEDQDASNAAVTLQMDNYYDNNLKVIVSSNKPVNDGDLVRLDEASTQ